MMKRTVEFCSHVANLCQVRKQVRTFLGEAGCSEDITDLLVLGIDEACSNVIRHAYECRDDQPIRLALERVREKDGTIGVRFRLRDYGPPIDPAKLNGRALDDVKPGGLGLHFIRQVFDRAYYLRKRDGTELVLTKMFRLATS
jgi:anti-sigma regulatory factor (Ser/Thr protein kinase)